MAYIIPNKTTVDSLPDVAVGVSLPFNGLAVFNQTFITRDQVKTNLINFFLTNKGERYMNPGFGGGLRKILFESISNNTLDNIEAILKEQLSKVFPTINIDSLQINSLPDENLINVYIAYNVLNQPLDEIEINFNSDGI